MITENDTVWDSVHQRLGQKLLDVLQLLRQLEGLEDLLIQCCSGWPKKLFVLCEDELGEMVKRELEGGMRAKEVKLRVMGDDEESETWKSTITRSREA